LRSLHLTLPAPLLHRLFVSHLQLIQGFIDETGVDITTILDVDGGEDVRVTAQVPIIAPQTRARSPVTCMVSQKTGTLSSHEEDDESADTRGGDADTRALFSRLATRLRVDEVADFLHHEVSDIA
jgi:hypothetical protein